MNQPLISVIIPIYNMERYLERCLDSVIGNTYRNLEILCVDDGSTDHSLEILRAYEEKDSRIVVITKENGGVSSARNAGLDQMTGEFVTFIDSDDFVHPQFFELLRKVQVLSGADIAAAQHQKVYMNQPEIDMPRYSLEKNDITLLDGQQILKKVKHSSACTDILFPRSVLISTRFRENCSYGEDTIFCHELIENNPSIKFGVIDLCIYYYYQDRAESLVHRGRDRGILYLISFLAEKASAKETEALYFESMLKRARYFRYYYTYVQKNRELSKALGGVLRHRVPQLMRSKNISKKNKLVWSLFMLSPGIDRLHRLYRDPSIKREETAQKNRVQ